MLCVLCKTGELQGLAGIARGDLPRYHLSGIDRELIFRYGSDLVGRWAVLRSGSVVYGGVCRIRTQVYS